jgi:hypothetical protein
MPSSSKNMELCEVLRKIWSYAKFCQKYGIMRSFAENMELYEVLPKIWNYVKFCQKYKVMS